MAIKYIDKEGNAATPEAVKAEIAVSHSISRLQRRYEALEDRMDQVNDEIGDIEGACQHPVRFVVDGNKFCAACGKGV